MRIKRFAALILGCFLCVGAFGTLTGCGKKSASNEFIYWMAESENAEY